MAPELLLVGGIVLLAVSIAVVAYAFGGGLTGVAASLSLIEQQVSTHEVGRNELAARERLLIPVLRATRSLGVRLSPAGTAGRLGHLLDAREEAGVTGSSAYATLRPRQSPE